ncbi:class F sortase [Bacillus sp. SCS-153A]|uniref:class F sortase n=1 Tax=Rossellomorea sedimentorum TaxID=3115294 RepID=UPI0039063B37
MRFLIFSLLLLFLSACSNAEMEKEQSATEPKPPAEPEAAVASTTTSASPFADSILKDERIGIVPVELEIPSIGVSAEVESVGLKENGEMDVTESFEKTGWYEKGYHPGEPGSAVIGGHVDSRDGPAVFYDLNKLALGDEIIVKGENGEEKVFVVTGKEEYPWNEAPLQKIFGYTHSSSLNLITCTGTFDRSTRNYDKRLVVYTQLK